MRIYIYLLILKSSCDFTFRNTTRILHFLANFLLNSAYNITRRHRGARKPRSFPVFYKNIEILILAASDRPAEALQLTRILFVPKSHLPSDFKTTIFNQTAEELVKSVMKAQDQDLLQELKTLLEFFENNDQVEVLSKTLEEYLLAPIEYLPIPDRRSKKKTTT